VEPAARRPSPLTLALLLPAIGLAVAALLWLGSHARGDRQPTSTRPTASATAGPTPWPLAWRPEDGGSLDPATAYGRLALQPPTTPPPPYTATLNADATVPPPGRPDPRRGAVQRITPLDTSSIAAIAIRLGPTAAPTQQGTVTRWPDTRLTYDAATSTFTWQPTLREGVLPATPRDTNSAAAAARDWLLQRGLVEPLAPVVATQVSRGNQAAFPTWRITAPHLGGQSLVTEITMTVSASGSLSDMVIAHPVVAGASSYPVVDWEKAWAVVQTGRSNDIEAPTAGSTPYSLHIDSVQLNSRLVHTATGAYVLPAYAFIDSAAHVTVWWPALDPAQYTLP
jgi:hypothetical protein